jgi:hypothetical protein
VVAVTASSYGGEPWAFFEAHSLWQDDAETVEESCLGGIG